MRIRSAPLHRVIVDEEHEDSPLASEDSLVVIRERLEEIRERLGRLPASRSVVYLDLTIETLKSEFPDPRHRSM
jgi:hypothetical protein